MSHSGNETETALLESSQCGRVLRALPRADVRVLMPACWQFLLLQIGQDAKRCGEKELLRQVQRESELNEETGREPPKTEFDKQVGVMTSFVHGVVVLVYYMFGEVK